MSDLCLKQFYRGRIANNASNLRKSTSDARPVSMLWGGPSNIQQLLYALALGSAVVGVWSYGVRSVLDEVLCGVLWLLGQCYSWAMLQSTLAPSRIPRLYRVRCAPATSGGCWISCGWCANAAQHGAASGTRPSLVGCSRSPQAWCHFDLRPRGVLH